MNPLAKPWCISTSLGLATVRRRTLERHVSARSFSAGNTPLPVQSLSPLSPLGVSAALQAAAEPSSITPKPKIFEEFSLSDRVGIVSGGNRGLGLEMALALCEAGARAIYCIDLPATPSQEWESTRDFVQKMGVGSRLEYISADVRNQTDMWAKVADIAEREGRMDLCVAAAGILKTHTDCLEYPAEQFKEVRTLPESYNKLLS